MLRMPHSGAATWFVPAVLLLLVGCALDDAPTMPQAPMPDLGRATFHLTIDAQTGAVSVNRVGAAAARASGASFSLVGDDALTLHTTNCTWTDIGKKTRRCSFDLALENRLSDVDLVTPTTFPRAPQGVDGILVFPFSAAALGTSGGTATPSPDWDYAPANFFNDFAGCSGKANDCYPYEVYPGPLYGGESTAPRTVGFDVDRSAHTVSAYIVVAADLRDNPVQTAVILGNPNACGTVELRRSTSEASSSTGFPLTVGNRDELVDGRVDRGFCSFDLGDRYILDATLRVVQFEADADSYMGGDVVVVDHVDFGPTLDGSDFDLVPLAANIGTISSDGALEAKTLNVTTAVREDIVQGRTRSQFRLRYRDDETAPTRRVRFEGYANFDGTPLQNPPALIVSYRMK